MDFDEVVARACLLAHDLRSLLRATDAVVVERGPRREEPRTEHFVARNALAQRQVRRLAEHAARRRDAVCHVEKQDFLDVIFVVAGRDVCMHLGEPRNEIETRAVDDAGVRGSFALLDRADRPDALAAHDDRSSGEHALGIERHYRDVAKHGRLLSRQRSREQ